MIKFDIGFNCNGDCENCSGASASFCPGTTEVFSHDEEGWGDEYSESLYIPDED